jgi:hypothetical protein
MLIDHDELDKFIDQKFYLKHKNAVIVIVNYHNFLDSKIKDYISVVDMRKLTEKWVNPKAKERMMQKWLSMLYIRNKLFKLSKIFEKVSVKYCQSFMLDNFKSYMKSVDDLIKEKESTDKKIREEINAAKSIRKQSFIEN